MLGACSVSGLVMLDMAFVWGAEWNLVSDLHKLKGDNAIFDESGRHMKVRTELIGQAQALQRRVESTSPVEGGLRP